MKTYNTVHLKMIASTSVALPSKYIYVVNFGSNFTRENPNAFMIVPEDNLCWALLFTTFGSKELIPGRPKGRGVRYFCSVSPWPADMSQAAILCTLLMMGCVSPLPTQEQNQASTNVRIRFGTKHPLDDWFKHVVLEAQNNLILRGFTHIY